jgi:phytoene desaturase
MKEFVPKNYDSFLDFFTRKMMTQGTKLHVFEKMQSYVKRFVKHPYLQKILQYPLVFLGTAPKDAPALYNIMSYVDFGMGVFYPKG